MIEYNRTIYERRPDIISAKILKWFRLFRKLTQEELAIMSGLTDTAIRIYK